MRTQGTLMFDQSIATKKSFSKFNGCLSLRQGCVYVREWNNQMFFILNLPRPGRPSTRLRILVPGPDSRGPITTANEY